MRELYIGVIKKMSYKELIYISLSELISKKYGCFVNKKIKINNKKFFTKHERRILQKIYYHTNGKIFSSEIKHWYLEIKKELLKYEYIKKSQILGYTPTKTFKKEIKKNSKKFNMDIIKFIRTKNIKFLKNIINNIEEIKIPIVEKNDPYPWTYYYHDRYDMLEEAVSHRFGKFNYLEKRKSIRYKSP